MPNTNFSSSDVDGLLIVGHGTRDKSGLAEFQAVVDEVARRCPGRPVVPCFLELAEPTIAEGVASLAERGVQMLQVLPLLLFAAGHAKRDIPAAVSMALNQYPGLRFSQSPPLESQPAIVRLSAQRFDEATRGRADVPADETLLVLVGRGSLDPEAIAAFAHFAEVRFAERPVGGVETAFLAMAEPRLPRVLERVAGLHFRRIVVQPHLLFQGELVDGARNAVAAAATTWKDKEWIVAQHLGDRGFIAEALLHAAGLAKSASEDDLAFLERCV